MNRYTTFGVLVLLSGLLVIGCSGDRNPADAPKDEGPSGPEYLLSESPAGVKCVIDARKDAQDGDEVVVAGRIGGSKSPWIEGRAGFWIVDPSFKPCDEENMIPWEFCCTPQDELRKGMA